MTLELFVMLFRHVFRASKNLDVKSLSLLHIKHPSKGSPGSSSVFTEALTLTVRLNRMFMFCCVFRVVYKTLVKLVIYAFVSVIKNLTNGRVSSGRFPLHEYFAHDE